MQKEEVENFVYHFFDHNSDFLSKIIDSLGPVKLIAADCLIEKLICSRPPVAGDDNTVIVLRSITTSGIWCVDTAKKHGLNSCEIVSIFDRGRGAREFIENSGFAFRSIMNVNI